MAQVDVLEAHPRQRFATAKDQIVLWRCADAGSQGLANDVAAAPCGGTVMPVFRFGSRRDLYPHWEGKRLFVGFRHGFLLFMNCIGKMPGRVAYQSLCSMSLRGSFVRR